MKNQSNKFKSRPMSSNNHDMKKTLGSVCPVIIKHEFPNESKEYIDDVLQQMSSTQKRFRYNNTNIRPMTAKSKLQTKKMSLQNQNSLGNSGQNWRPQTAAVTGGGHSNLDNLTSAELYKKLLHNKGQTNEKRFQIKPQKKLNTFSIHSALYKVKKQKEYLDQKIQELEDRKTNFKQTDFYLIANAGAMEYIFNMQENQQSQQDQVSQIMNKSKPISEKKSVPSSRPYSGKPKKQKPDYLKPDTHVDLEDQQNQFNIIGNVQKFFKTVERQGVRNWGDNNNSNSNNNNEDQKENTARSQSIKNKIEDMSRNQSNIQFLMASIENDYDNSEEKINELQEEEQNEEEEMNNQFQQQQQQQQIFSQSQTVGFNSQQLQNNNNAQQLQYNPQQYSHSINNKNKSLQLNQNFMQNQVSPYQTISQKSQGNSHRFNQTYTNGFRPVSAQMQTTNSQGLLNKVNARPQTAKSGPLHAVMSFGQTQKAKKNITRNFDHLEILRQKREEKQLQHQQKQKKKSHKRMQNSLSVSGSSIEVFGESFKQQRIPNSAQISRALNVPQSAKYKTQYKIDTNLVQQYGLDDNGDQELLNNNFKQQQIQIDDLRAQQQYQDYQMQQQQQFQMQQQYQTEQQV